MITTLWLNGEFVLKDKPLIHHDDSGFLRAAGVFDSMLAVNGSLVAADEHYQRLIHDCEKVLRITPDLSFDLFTQTAQDLLKHNHIFDDHYARIRTQITGGVLKEFLGKPENPTISMSCSRTRRPDNQANVEAWIISDYPRIAGCPLENCKKLDYTRAYCAMLSAKEKGGNEPIMINTDGNIACASTSSLFIVEGSNVITPPLSDGILDSISRRFLIRDYSAQQDSISPKRLHEADAVFLSNTIRGVRPITTIDGKERSIKEWDGSSDLHHKIFQAA